MEKQNYRELRSQPQFLKLLFANIISRFGDSVDVIAYSWIVYEITGSEATMALLVGLNYIPTVFFTPFAGAIVENLPKKKVMYIADICRFILVSTIFMLYQSQMLTVSILVCTTLLTSLVECFRNPSATAVTPQILDKKYYKLGKGASQSASSTSELLGFLSVGGIIATIGADGALLLDAATFLISAVIISTLKLEETLSKKELELKKIVENFKEGLAYAKESQVIKSMVWISTFINFGMMSLGVFKTPYVVNYLEEGAEFISYMQIFNTVGLMLGSFITPKIRKIPSDKLILMTGVPMGISLMVLGIAPTFGDIWWETPLVFLCMFLVGLAFGILNVVIGTAFMNSVPSEWLGRMSGVVTALTMISVPLSSFICSALALKLTILQIFALFGGITVVAYVTLFLTRVFACFNDDIHS